MIFMNVSLVLAASISIDKLLGILLIFVWMRIVFEKIKGFDVMMKGSIVLKEVVEDRT